MQDQKDLIESLRADAEQLKEELRRKDTKIAKLKEVLGRKDEEFMEQRSKTLDVETALELEKGEHMETQLKLTHALEQGVDPLTGLWSRISFRKNAEELLELCRRDKLPATMFYIDLNDFKPINDRHGHAAGDHALKEAVALIKVHLRRGSEVFGREGGDEFVLFLPHTDLEHATMLAEKIKDAFAAHKFIWGGDSFSVGLSIGIAQTSEGLEESVEELIEDADVAMYREKNQGKNKGEE